MPQYGGSLSSLGRSDVYRDEPYTRAAGASDAVSATAPMLPQTQESPRAIAMALVGVILALMAVRIVYELAEST